MIQKTRGIVLHQLKYSDSAIVVQIYTQDLGRLSFLVRCRGNKKPWKQKALFQPMLILDLEIYYKESREMQLLKEYSVSYSPVNIMSNIRKTGIAIFLGEVLTTVLRQESPNKDLFRFIEDSIVYFDSTEDKFANFHIAFLGGLTSYLGLEPGKRSGSGDLFFDMINGAFVSSPPHHNDYADPQTSTILAAFFSTSFEKSLNLPLSGSQRNKVLEILLKYYSVHLPGLKKIRSLDILKEVFE